MLNNYFKSRYIIALAALGFAPLTSSAQLKPSPDLKIDKIIAYVSAVKEPPKMDPKVYRKLFKEDPNISFKQLTQYNSVYIVSNKEKNKNDTLVYLMNFEADSAAKASGYPVATHWEYTQLPNQKPMRNKIFKDLRNPEHLITMHEQPYLDTKNSGMDVCIANERKDFRENFDGIKILNEFGTDYGWLVPYNENRDGVLGVMYKIPDRPMPPQTTASPSVLAVKN